VLIKLFFVYCCCCGKSASERERKKKKSERRRIIILHAMPLLVENCDYECCWGAHTNNRKMAGDALLLLAYNNICENLKRTFSH
jgi:hypothetical protein